MAAQVSQALEVWYDQCADQCNVDALDLRWDAIDNAFRVLARVTYRSYRARLRHPYRTGRYGGIYLEEKQQRVARGHVVTVCTAFGEERMGAIFPPEWAGICVETIGGGTPRNPIRVRIDPERVAGEWGRTNTVIHELGHAAGIRDECTDIEPECVMYHKLAQHQLSQLGVPWSSKSAPHALMHINQIRARLGYKLF